MNAWLMIIMVLGQHGHAVDSVGFQSKESCESAKTEIVERTQPTAAPGWFSNRGKKVMIFCVENK